MTLSTDTPYNVLRHITISDLAGEIFSGAALEYSKFLARKYWTMDGHWRVAVYDHNEIPYMAHWSETFIGIINYLQVNELSDRASRIDIHYYSGSPGRWVSYGDEETG